MDIPTKKLQNGFGMPVFGLGTSGIGGSSTQRLGDQNDARDMAAVQAAIDLGITHIDTAEIYAQGYSEILVGQAIKKYDRKKLFLVSKAAIYNLSYDGIKEAIIGTLKRLQIDYLDNYLIHRYPGNDKLAECMKAMNELADEGLIKNIGISNFNLEHTKRAQELSAHPIVATQVHYNLIYREPASSGLLDYCQKNNIMLIAWRPVEKGLLAKTGTPLVDELCQKYGKTPSQIAINWLITQPNVITLAKTSDLTHLKENLGALGWQMSPEDITRLTNNFPNQQTASGIIPLE